MTNFFESEFLEKEYLHLLSLFIRTCFKLYNKESQQISEVTLLLHCLDTARLVVLLSLTLQQWFLTLSNQRGDWNKTIKKTPCNGGRKVSFRQKGLSGQLFLFQEPGVLVSHWCLNSPWLMVHRRSQVIWTVSWPSEKGIWTQICLAAVQRLLQLTKLVHCKQMVLKASKCDRFLLPPLTLSTSSAGRWINLIGVFYCSLTLWGQEQCNWIYKINPYWNCWIIRTITYTNIFVSNYVISE